MRIIQWFNRIFDSNRNLAGNIKDKEHYNNVVASIAFLLRNIVEDEDVKQIPVIVSLFQEFETIVYKTIDNDDWNSELEFAGITQRIIIGLYILMSHWTEMGYIIDPNFSEKVKALNFYFQNEFIPVLIQKDFLIFIDLPIHDFKELNKFIEGTNSLKDNLRSIQEIILRTKDKYSYEH